MQSFRTHTGEIVEGERLAAALAIVANDWRELAHAIRRADNYASHVTEETKAAALARDLECADRVEAGEVKSFAIWQRVNTVLTGECVALLP
jgi:hypothetical protein